MLRTHKKYTLKTEEHGKLECFAIVYASISNYDNKPEMKGRHRTVLLPSGFDIRPHPNNPSNHCKVSYRAHMTNESV